MKKVVNVGTIGHIDHSALTASVFTAVPVDKVLARKKKKRLRELARRQKRLDKLTQK